ncbi:N2,N2-dimethylguanosine tRNA methyltransferase [Trichodelitschia bisporula]|uniref:tRNA (guanine(26)-N(2))-dimethyltransferase n=1 Tax=Trichodelitschia bisporula TaxID=703511 RepID=A0A6G1HQP0_9PEZI|nr:N2,N2-dimethylguanosine tRNA methyltransferase [Trichodelitschia bisporula]
MSANTETPGTDRPEAPQAGSLDSQPAAEQIIRHEDKLYTTIKEGLAFILAPPEAPLLTDPKTQRDGAAPKQSVFYNPIQQYNRDLTVLAIRGFGEEFLAAKEAKGSRKGNKNKGKKGRSDTKGKEQSGESQATANGRTDGPPATKRKRTDDGSEAVDEVQPLKKAKVVEDNTAPEANGGAVKDVTSKGRDSLLSAFDELDDEDLLACEASIQATQAGATQAEAQHKPPEEQQKPPQEKPQNGPEAPKKQPALRILDALSATGLRALRYASELPFPTIVTANDLSPKAVATINLNIQHNKLSSQIRTTTGNANAHMYSFAAQEGVGGPGPKYDVIDLDPYGTAVPFLDAALQALSDGGLLCVTCTDSAVFNSTGYLEKTYAMYGGLPIKGEHYSEGGLRLILHAIATSAAKLGCAIEPLLSLSIDYYARVFVRVRRSAAHAKFLASKTMLVYTCDSGCGSWSTQHLARATAGTGTSGGMPFYKHAFAQGPTAEPHCAHCGFKTHVAGPMWGGPLHNPSFVSRLLDLLPVLDDETYGTKTRIEGMLTTALEETRLLNSEVLFAPYPPLPREGALFTPISPAAADRHPFYFIPSSLARVLKTQAPSGEQMRGALRGLGYTAVRSHAKPGAIKTDAGWGALWDVMRAWVAQKAPVKEGALGEGMAGWRIMNPGVEPGRKAKGDEGDKMEGVENEEKVEVEVKEIVFDEKLGKDHDAKRLVRYQLNPRANWGPMTRAK